MKKVVRIPSALGLLLLAGIWAHRGPSPVAGQTRTRRVPSVAAGDWPMYTADTRGSRYSPLDQIDASNFSKLEVAWTFKTDNLGVRPEQKLQGTPVAVNGRLYTTAGTGGKAVIALDGKTGELLWVHRHPEGERASRWSPRPLSGRGVAYWTNGRGDDRIVYLTTGYQLVELDANTGQYIRSFGRDGVVDLKMGVIVGRDTQIDLEKGEIGQHAPPMVVGDVILVGSSMSEGMAYPYSTNAKGLVRAFDARTGRLLWRFDTIPKPGQFGNQTWQGGSWEWTGNAGAWAQITADPEAGLAYLPVETPTMDYYGGNRPGDDLFAETLVAVDLKTGIRKWHYQFVHHPLWDYDIPAAPLLVDATIDGRPRKLVAQPTKQGWLYVFDRLTGEPIWPIVEREVPQSDVPGERTSRTQPFVTKPPAYSRTFVARDDIIDFTPALHSRALELLAPYRWEETPYVPPAYAGPGGRWRGAINIGNTLGGVNWPGGAFDPETAIVYAQANNSSITAASFSAEDLARISPDAQARSGRHPRWEAEPDFGLPKPNPATPEPAATAPAPAGSATAAPAPATTARPQFTIEGIPILKPPYGVLAAIDLNKGAMLFRVPHGETPDSVRAAFQKLGINYPQRTGQSGNTGVLVTKTMVVAGDLQVTHPPGRPAAAAMLRAYDKQSGREIGAVAMPNRVSGSPMTYMIDGRQYINIAVYGLGNGTGTYVTYRLPESRPEHGARQAAGR